MESTQLRELDVDNVSSVPNMGVVCKALVTSVYDADTCTCVFLHNGLVPMKMNIRILGIDAPEIKPTVRDPILADLEKKTAYNVRDHVREIMLDKIVDLKMLKWDKYGGRVLGNISIENVDIAQYLMDKEIVKSYDGNAKESWTKDELDNITKKIELLKNCPIEEQSN